PRTPTRDAAPSSQIPLLAIGATRNIGDYEVIGQIGQGASSRVYQGKHMRTGDIVAIKLLHLSSTEAKARKRFASEAAMMSTLRHPNILNLIEVGRVADTDFLVMEYAGGGDAIGLVREHGGKLTEAHATRLILQCAEALVAVHAAGVAHRDIKPSNIFLSKAGDAKLGDFGLALDRHRDAQLTADGMTVGTPAYMAPEQIRGNRDEAQLSDIYGLGATWFHLLCGRPPFDEATAYATFLAVERNPVPDPRTLDISISEDCWIALQLMMKKKHTERPQSVGEVVALLHSIPH
ncbi:MAG: serine/threonine-protein kinase, partial [Planctomycetota bacterium]|nr:serine/threonine-protein kinase [Planctomycetota bacterium]